MSVDASGPTLEEFDFPGGVGSAGDPYRVLGKRVLRFGQFFLECTSSLLQGVHLCFGGGDYPFGKRRKQWLKPLVSIEWA